MALGSFVFQLKVIFRDIFPSKIDENEEMIARKEAEFISRGNVLLSFGRFMTEDDVLQKRNEILDL